MIALAAEDRLWPSKTLLAAVSRHIADGDLMPAKNIFTEVAGGGRGQFSFLTFNESISAEILVSIGLRNHP